MKKILLVVSSHEDAALLPAAAKAIGRVGCGLLWVWHSPILGIDPAKECKTIDDEIRALTQGEKAAADVGDYETAKSRKAEREKLLLNRSVEVRNAWKRVSAEGRKEAIGRYMEPLMNILNPNRDTKGMGIRISAFPEHQEPDLWIASLNEVKAVLEKDGFKGGTFALMWPKQLADADQTLERKTTGTDEVTAAFQRQSEELKAKSAKVPLPPIVNPANPPTFAHNAGQVIDRSTQLTKMTFFELQSVAKKNNIIAAKRPRADVVREIMAAESVPA